MTNGRLRDVKANECQADSRRATSNSQNQHQNDKSGEDHNLQSCHPELDLTKSFDAPKIDGQYYNKYYTDVDCRIDFIAGPVLPGR